MRRVFRFIILVKNLENKRNESSRVSLTVACVKNNAPIRQTDDSFSRSRVGIRVC